MANVYGVVLAGGKGERLWPLSRQEFPKQLLSLSHKSLLEHTRDRLAVFIDPQTIKIVTLQEQAATLEHYCDSRSLICEPYARNTAAAILLTCFTIAQEDPNAVVLFYPADHYIPDTEKFVAVQKKVIEHCKNNDCITLVGIKPTHPATGYGYIECIPSDNEIVHVKQFHEKPTLEKAELYCQSSAMVWNIGIFAGKVSVFLEEFKNLAPEMYALIHDYYTTGDKESYNKVESISIDYALMEKSNNLMVMPADFAWSDVGNLATFLSLQASEDLQKPLEVNAANNMVMAKSLTVLIGVHNLCVVQTDDVLLIAQKDDVELVKNAVTELKKKNLQKYL